MLSPVSVAPSPGALNGPEWTTTVEAVSPSLAIRWLTECQYERQRNISPSHVDLLVEALQAGTFKPTAIEFYQVGDRSYLVDGQHRLEAIARAGVSTSLIVIRRQVPAMADVDTAYIHTDRGRMRTYGHIYGALALRERYSLTDTAVRFLGAAVVPILAGFESPAMSPVTRSVDARVTLMAEWAEEARTLMALYGDTARGKWGRQLLSAVPMAVALVTLRYAPTIAERFWRDVAANEGLWKKEPSHTLVTYISERGRRNGGVPQYARAIALAWNAEYDRRSLSMIKVTKQMLARPLDLKGTPYTGREVVLPQSVSA